MTRRRTNHESNRARHQVNNACEESPQDCEECRNRVDSERKDALEDGDDRIKQSPQDLRHRVVKISNCVRYGRHGNSSRKGRYRPATGVKKFVRLSDN